MADTTGSAWGMEAGSVNIGDNLHARVEIRYRKDKYNFDGKDVLMIDKLMDICKDSAIVDLDPEIDNG